MDDSQNIQFEREDNFIEIVKLALESIAVYKAMCSLPDQYTDNSAYITLMNNSAMIAVIRISNILGTNQEDNHWKKMFDADDNKFKEQVILKVFENDEKYKKYHENLIHFRNKYIVHFTVGESKYKINKNYLSLPDLDIAKRILCEALFYLLDYFDYENKENIRIEVNEFYNRIMEDAVKLFTFK